MSWRRDHIKFRGNYEGMQIRVRGGRNEVGDGDETSSALSWEPLRRWFDSFSPFDDLNGQRYSLNVTKEFWERHRHTGFLPPPGATPGMRKTMQDGEWQHSRFFYAWLMELLASRCCF